jgi:hypothetical protein
VEDTAAHIQHAEEAGVQRRELVPGRIQRMEVVGVEVNSGEAEHLDTENVARAGDNSLVEVHKTAGAASLRADTQQQVGAEIDHRMVDVEAVNALVVEGNVSLASCSLEGRWKEQSQLI